MASSHFDVGKREPVFTVSCQNSSANSVDQSPTVCRLSETPNNIEQFSVGRIWPTPERPHRAPSFLQIRRLMGFGLRKTRGLPPRFELDLS